MAVPLVPGHASRVQRTGGGREAAFFSAKIDTSEGAPGGSEPSHPSLPLSPPPSPAPAAAPAAAAALAAAAAAGTAFYSYYSGRQFDELAKHNNVEPKLLNKNCIIMSL